MMHTLFKSCLMVGFFSTYLPSKGKVQAAFQIFSGDEILTKNHKWKDVVLKCWLHHPRFFVENSMDWHLISTDLHWSHWYYRYLPYNMQIDTNMFNQTTNLYQDVDAKACQRWIRISNRCIWQIEYKCINNDWTRWILARSSISEYPILWVNWAGFKESLYWLNI